MSIRQVIGETVVSFGDMIDIDKHPDNVRYHHILTGVEKARMFIADRLQGLGRGLLETMPNAEQQ